MTSRRPAPTDLVKRYRQIAPGTLGHLVDQGVLDPAIRPLYRGISFVGPARTLALPPGDTSLTRPAIDGLRPGDVLVIDQGGDQRACWGEMTSLAAQAKGCAAVIIDGAVTDSQAITEHKMPTYARWITPLVGRRLDLGGELDSPIRCGGALVRAGDLVVGDDDGVVFLSLEQAVALYERASAAQDREPAVKRWLRAGGSLAEVTGLDSAAIEALLAEREQAGHMRKE